VVCLDFPLLQRLTAPTPRYQVGYQLDRCVNGTPVIHHVSNDRSCVKLIERMRGWVKEGDGVPGTGDSSCGEKERKDGVLHHAS